MEQVLHADNLGTVRGVPELFEADVAQADTSDETLVAGLDHGGQLIIEARVGAAGAGQAEVDRGQLADPQAAEIVFDALAQLARIIVGDDGAGVPADPDFADDRQLTRIGESASRIRSLTTSGP